MVRASPPVYGFFLVGAALAFAGVVSGLGIRLVSDLNCTCTMYAAGFPKLQSSFHFFISVSRQAFTRSPAAEVQVVPDRWTWMRSTPMVAMCAKMLTVPAR